MSLSVRWDGEEVGRLELAGGERSREYAFTYAPGAPRAISLSLPLDRQRLGPAEARPFFEGLLPEGVVREQVARQLRLAPGDSYGLLAALGRDCAGALQIVDGALTADEPSVRWLDDHALAELVEDLPHHPLGIRAGDAHMRLSLAGVQGKVVLVRDGDGRFGEPLDGMPSTHILKPEPPGDAYPGLAVNEWFCMRLADRCGLPAARVELLTIGGTPTLAVERFDRDAAVWPPRRIHQEDLCQALGLAPDFKYQHPDWRLPSYAGLAELLAAHGSQPGRDRLAAARAAVFDYLVGNADAHAKNVSLLHLPGGARLAPLYDIVSTAAYPQLSTGLALGIGDEHDPEAIGAVHWSDLADDLGLQPRAFERERAELVERVLTESRALREEARAGGLDDPVLDAILAVIARRAERAAR